MPKSNIVVHAGPEESRKLCEMLDRHHYRAIPMHSLDELMLTVRKEFCDAVILDLDCLAVDNRFIRNLCKGKPGVFVIGASGRTFHPELEEAMRTHILACLSKPVDEDELIYWLKSIRGSEPGSRASPCKTLSD